VELLPDDARASRHSALFPFALSIDGERRLIALSSGPALFEWAAAIHRRGVETVPEAVARRATQEAIALCSSFIEYEASPAAIDERVLELLLWGADLGGLSVPDGKESKCKIQSSSIAVVGGEQVQFTYWLGWLLAARPLEMVLCLCEGNSDLFDRKKAIAGSFRADYIMRKVEVLRGMLDRGVLNEELIDYLRPELEDRPHSTHFGNAVQLLGEKMGFVEAHRRRLHSDEQELAYALVARGAGTTANARAASEVERAGRDVPSLDLSEAQWWRDREAIKGEVKKEGKDPDFFTNQSRWLDDHPFDAAKHRLAVTAIPMTPLL
jgi:hypothetical protein